MSRYKNFGLRFLSFLIDLVIVIIIASVLEKLFISEYEFIKKDNIPFYLILLWIVLLHGYRILFHIKFGQTLGKMLMKIKVVSVFNKGKVNLSQAIYRELIPIALFFPYEAVGVDLGKIRYNIELLYLILISIDILIIIDLLIHPQQRAVHDRIADTIVIRLG